MPNKDCASNRDTLDTCMIAALLVAIANSQKNKVSGISLFVLKILQDIGKSLLSPLIASLFEGNDSVRYQLHLMLPNLYSSEYVMGCAEQVMFLRYFVSFNIGGWKDAVSSTIKKIVY